MRTAAILAALAATFSPALADVLCYSEILHYKPRMISASEREGFSITIDEICSNTVEEFVRKSFESAIFSRSCTENTFSEIGCKANFQSIIKTCIAGKNTGGGSFITNGLDSTPFEHGMEVPGLNSLNDTRYICLRLGIALIRLRLEVLRPCSLRTQSALNDSGRSKQKRMDTSGTGGESGLLRNGT